MAFIIMVNLSPMKKYDPIWIHYSMIFNSFWHLSLILKSCRLNLNLICSWAWPSSASACIILNSKMTQQLNVFISNSSSISFKISYFGAGYSWLESNQSLFGIWVVEKANPTINFILSFALNNLISCIQILMSYYSTINYSTNSVKMINQLQPTYCDFFIYCSQRYKVLQNTLSNSF